ncbi:MAG: histidine kinase dimerization/phospho-acceptor domain-containing protein [Anaeromyxobacter sp.]
MPRWSPPLRAFLAGEGPEVLLVPGAAGPVELARVAGEGGALVLARPPRSAEWLEHVGRSQGLPRLVAGVAHDIKNPLNAMALQLALLTEKLSGAGEAAAQSGSHLGAIRGRIGRVNEVVRRFLDVTDPAAPLGYTNLGGLAADAAGLCGHDARRRQIELTVEAPRGAVRTRCEPGRVGPPGALAADRRDGAAAGRRPPGRARRGGGGARRAVNRARRG